MNIQKEWFIYFEIKNNLTGQKKNFQKRGGINRIKDIKERLKAGNVLKHYWTSKLKNGWSPWKTVQIAQFESFENLKFNEAVDFALSKCEVAATTKKNYRGTCNYVKDAALDLGLSSWNIVTIKRMHIKLLMQHIREKRKWSNKSYNKNLRYLSGVLSQLVQWEILEYNPAEKIQSMPVTETKKFIPYTEEEKRLIREHLFLNHYRFFIFFLLVYDVGMRPKEVLSLKIKSINFKDSLIVIQPDILEGNSKTRKVREIPINKHLIVYLRGLGLDLYSDDLYIFGNPFAVTRRGRYPGNIDGYRHPNFMKPSENKIPVNYPNKFWRKEIVQWLGINKYLYAAKHTGANDKILAGIPLDALKDLYGHGSKFMTRKYATIVEQKHREQIVDKSPEFGK